MFNTNFRRRISLKPIATLDIQSEKLENVKKFNTLQL